MAPLISEQRLSRMSLVVAAVPTFLQQNKS
jgi:hypothetical protein